MAEILDIYVREQGSNTVRRNLDGILDSAQRATGALRLMQNALFVIGGAGIVSAIGQLIDTTTNFENRLRLITKSQKEFNFVQKEVYEIASRTRSNFEATAQIYTRTALAVRGLGYSQVQTLKFTELLNKAVILSGTSTKEAGASLLQLSQGLSSGRLQGDELRSVLEQIPYLADLIGKELVRVGKISGVALNNAGDPIDVLLKTLFNARGELRKFGKDGEITTKIIFDAVLNAEKELESGFAKTVSTISQSFEVLRTETLSLLDTFEDSFGVGEAFSSIILLLANNLDTLTSGVVTFGAVFATLKFSQAVNGISSYIAKNKELRDAIANGNATLLTSEERLKARDTVIANSAKEALGVQIVEANLAKNRISSALSEKLAKQQIVSVQNSIAQKTIESILLSKQSLSAKGEETREFQKFKQVLGQVVSSSVFANAQAKESVALSKEVSALRNAESLAIAALALKQGEYAKASEESDKVSGRLNTRFDKLKRFLPFLAVELDLVAASLRGLLSLAVANPLTALAVGLVAVGAAVYAMSDTIKIGGKESSTTLQDYFDSAFSDILEGSIELGSEMVSPFKMMLQDIGSILEELALSFGVTMQELKDASSSTGSFIGSVLSSTLVTLKNKVIDLFSSLKLAYLFAKKGVQEIVLNSNVDSPLAKTSYIDRQGNTIQKTPERIQIDQQTLRDNLKAKFLTESAIQRTKEGFTDRAKRSFDLGKGANSNETLDNANSLAASRKFQEEQKTIRQKEIKDLKTNADFQLLLRQKDTDARIAGIKNPRLQAIERSLVSAQDKLKRPLSIDEEFKLRLGEGKLFDAQQKPDSQKKSSALGSSSKSPSRDKANRGPTFQESLKDLIQENYLLSLNTKEREKASEVFSIQDKIKRSLTVAEKESVGSAVEQNRLLSNSSSLLEEIKQPLISYNEQLEALNTIQKKISAEEFSSELAKIKLDFLDTKKDPTSGLERAILKIKEDRKDLASEVAQVYSDLAQPQEQYALRLRAINFLNEQGAVSQDNYNSSLRQARIAFLETQTDFDSGYERALLKIEETSKDYASGIESVMTNAFSSISDSIADLAISGKADFSSLFKEIQRGLVKLASDQLIGQITGGIGSFIGLGATALSSGFSGASAGSTASIGSTASASLGSTASFGFPQFAEGGLASDAITKFNNAGGITSGGIPAVLHPNEAVIPLSRGRKIPVDLGENTSSGQNVKINIYNQSGGQVSSRKSNSGGTEIIDIIIQQAKDAVAGDILRGGTTMNSVIESRYGLNSSVGNQR